MAIDRTRPRGFLLTELIVGTALLGLALAALGASLQGASMFNDLQWTRQRCVNAAEAQLDSLVTVGKPIDEAEIRRLWPGIEVAIDRPSGSPAWNGLQLLRVTANGTSGVRRVVVRLERFVRMDSQ